MDRRWIMAAGALTLLATAFTSTSASAAVSGTDRSFVRNAAQAGLSEVAEAQMAIQKAVDPATRDFARRMVADHTAANNRLTDIANREGIAVPSRSNGQQRGEYDQLSNLDGRRFDRAYMSDQVAAHQAAVSLFRSELTDGTSERLRRFAATTLPTLRSHQQMSITVSENLTAGRGHYAYRRRHVMSGM